MNDSLYIKRPNLVIGFHGCDKALAEKVAAGKENDLHASTNAYDWLGPGIYFWENNLERAWDWAVEQSSNPHSSVMEPGVIGAIVDLGLCLDLTDNHFLRELKLGYEEVIKLCNKTGIEIPKNKGLRGSAYPLLRNLDCMVIRMVERLHQQINNQRYDSVRGVFWEGNELYPGAGFREKNHVQICICNPNCIKGYFLPREMNPAYPNP